MSTDGNKPRTGVVDQLRHVAAGAVSLGQSVMDWPKVAAAGVGVSAAILWGAQASVGNNHYSAWSVGVLVIWAIWSARAALRTADGVGGTVLCAVGAVVPVVVVWTVAIRPFPAMIAGTCAAVAAAGIWWRLRRSAGTTITRSVGSHFNADGSPKRGYRRKADAAEVAARMSAQDGDTMSVYECADPTHRCGMYHVGHQRPTRR